MRTFYAIPVVGAIAVANVGIHMSHGHHHEDRALYSYEKKLVKKFPWEPSECGLFDYECTHRVQAAKAGGIVKGH